MSSSLQRGETEMQGSDRVRVISPLPNLLTELATKLNLLITTLYCFLHTVQFI